MSAKQSTPNKYCDDWSVYFISINQPDSNSSPESRYNKGSEIHLTEEKYKFIKKAQKIIEKRLNEKHGIDKS